MNRSPQFTKPRLAEHPGNGVDEPDGPRRVGRGDGFGELTPEFNPPSPVIVAHAAIHPRGVITRETERKSQVSMDGPRRGAGVTVDGALNGNPGHTSPVLPGADPASILAYGRTRNSVNGIPIGDSYRRGGRVTVLVSANTSLLIANARSGVCNHRP